MKDLIWLMPMTVFLVVGYASGAYIDVRDPRLVRNPGGVWSPGRLLDDAQWTEMGLVARRRFFRGVLITLACAFVAIVALLAVTAE